MDKEIVIFIKPTLHCNLQCTYCYVLCGKQDKDVPSSMSRGTLRNSIIKFSQYFKNYKIKFIFHGGEPLLMPYSFYEEAAKIKNELDEQGHYIRFMIQTNLTLLTKKHIIFFRKHNFELGTSIDGPLWLHNKNRKFKNGKGTFSAVFKNLISSKDICLNKSCMTLSRQNVDFIEDIYSFFKYNKFSSVNLNVVACPPHHTNMITASEYSAAVIKFFKLFWYSNFNEHCVIPLDFYGMFKSLIFQKLSDMLNQNNVSQQNPAVPGAKCTNMTVVIGPRGDVFPCLSLFKPEHSLGNINSEGVFKLIDINSGLRKNLADRHNKNKKCRTCEYKFYCYAGCAGRAYGVYNDIFREDYYCRAYKDIIRFYLGIYKNEIEPLFKNSKEIGILQQEAERGSTNGIRLLLTDYLNMRASDTRTQCFASAHPQDLPLRSFMAIVKRKMAKRR